MASLVVAGASATRPFPGISVWQAPPLALTRTLLWCACTGSGPGSVAAHSPLLALPTHQESPAGRAFPWEGAASPPGPQEPVGKEARFHALRAKLEAREYHDLSTADVVQLYEFPIDKFQRLAIDAFLKGLSLVVCAPTSSGKTLVAEAAAAAMLLKGRKLFYTTPLKALSNQKLREFRELFGESNVGLLTGDAAVNRHAPILVMTTEILRNMLYQRERFLEEGSLLAEVDAIVLDEVHYLSDISRGTVWEETVIYCPKDISLICLSATVANPEELAGWIAQVHGPTELVTSSRRPVPLMWHFSARGAFLPLLNEQSTAMNRRLLLTQQKDTDFEEWVDERSRRKRGSSDRSRGGQKRLGVRKGEEWSLAEEMVSEEELQFLRRRQVPRIIDTVFQLKDRDMLPAIWFIFSRRGCDAATKYVQDAQLLSDEQVGKVELALSRFREQHPEAVRESAVKSLLCGVAAHHAGCLPAWKAFIEDLFQDGLIKLIFATETLAAGINMPARSTVLSSLSKRGDDGQMLLSSNSMLQMAGRAGRRGIDNQGHVVVIQTPFEGAEDCCNLLFAGPDPLVSQFTATYGMALNLLGRARPRDVPDAKPVKHGRSLEEARALVEKSFGNYIGSEVMVSAKQQLGRLEVEIAKLQEEGIQDTSQFVQDKLRADEWQEYAEAKARVQEAKRDTRDLRARVEARRVSMVQPILDAVGSDALPYICFTYTDAETGHEQVIPAIYVCSVPQPLSTLDNPMSSADLGLGNSEEPETDLEGDNSSDTEMPAPERTGTDGLGASSTGPQDGPQECYYVALASDNSWYMFTGRSVSAISKSCFVPSDATHVSLKGLFKDKLRSRSFSWQNLGRSGWSKLSSVWCAESSMDTWSWSVHVPRLSELTDTHPTPDDLVQLEKSLSNQRKEVTRLKKIMKNCLGYKEEKQLVRLEKSRCEKLARLQAKASRIATRIEKMQPTGWKEFLQVVNVLEAAEALKPESHELLELGEIAASIHGENELWLALVFRNSALNGLRPEELAAVCGSLVSDGIKSRPENGPSAIYQVSANVAQCVEEMDKTRGWLERLQEKHNVQISCELNTQFAGMVEAWAVGVTWKELIADCGMDEGDIARLLRRSIDLLSQIPQLPNISPQLAKTARLAAVVMDRPPISELIG